MDCVVLAVEDLERGDRPEDFLLDDRCVDVLDFDEAGPVEGAGRERSVSNGSAADDDLAQLAESSTIRSTRATAAEWIEGSIGCECACSWPGGTESPTRSLNTWRGSSRGDSTSPDELVTLPLVTVQVVLLGRRKSPASSTKRGGAGPSA